MDGSIILPHLLLWEHPYPWQHPWSADTLQDLTEEEICPLLEAIPVECGCQRNREALGALRERKRFSAFQAQLSSTE